MYAIFGDGIRFVDDVDLRRCVDNFLEIYSDFPKLNLTYDEPMRKDLTLYEKINISTPKTNFSSIPYTDVRRQYWTWRIVKAAIVIITVIVVFAAFAYDTQWLE